MALRLPTRRRGYRFGGLQGLGYVDGFKTIVIIKQVEELDVHRWEGINQ